MSDKDPKILFNGVETPAHEVWAKLELANRALGVMDRYNQGRPELASDYTREVAEEVRKRLGNIEVLMPKPRQKDTGQEDRAKLLLRTHAPEEVIEILKREFALDCDLPGLIMLAGTGPYLTSLANEASLLQNNAISWEQIAELWNEAHRPVPGKPFWDARTVEQLSQNKDL